MTHRRQRNFELSGLRGEKKKINHKLKCNTKTNKFIFIVKGSYYVYSDFVEVRW